MGASLNIFSAQRDTRSPLNIYKEKFGNVHGFFTEQAIAIWDFFLTLQCKAGITGNFLEIGVLRGKSAYLGAVHLRPNERCILLDINDISDVHVRIEALGIKTIRTTAFLRTDNPKLATEIAAYEGTVRWFHIDGDHSGYATANDLRLAAHLLGNRGIICVDDFLNPRYPQLIAAVYKFLFDRSFEYQMILCGMNKCYIARAADYAFYESAIRTQLSDYLKSVGHTLTISKSSYAHDMGCFAVVHRQGDFDYLGRDEDATDIPF
jgi:hypothetical protein